MEQQEKAFEQLNDMVRAVHWEGYLGNWISDELERMKSQEQVRVIIQGIGVMSTGTRVA